MGLEDIKRVNKDPDSYYRSQESDGQSRVQRSRREVSSERKAKGNIRSNRVIEETRPTIPR